MGKVISLDEFTSLRQSLKKKIVLIGGCFDVFHFGHLTFIKKAKEKGDLLVSVVESDQAMLAKKKGKPVHSQQERSQILASLEDVDYAIPIEFYEKDEDYLQLVRKIKPSIIAVTEGDRQIVNKIKQAESVGGEVAVVTPLLNKFSSTKIKSYASISGN